MREGGRDEKEGEAQWRKRRDEARGVKEGEEYKREKCKGGRGVDKGKVGVLIAKGRLAIVERRAEEKQ